MRGAGTPSGQNDLRMMDLPKLPLDKSGSIESKSDRESSSWRIVTPNQDSVATDKVCDQVSQNPEFPVRAGGGVGRAGAGVHIGSLWPLRNRWVIILSKDRDTARHVLPHGYTRPTYDNLCMPVSHPYLNSAIPRRRKSGVPGPSQEHVQTLPIRFHWNERFRC